MASQDVVGVDGTTESKAEMLASIGNRLDVLTFVMTIEYNGFQYAGFQRQTATPRSNSADDINSEAAVGAARHPKKGASSSGSTSRSISADNGNNNMNSKSQKIYFSPPPNKRPRKNKDTSTPNTIQHQIEMALQKWTNLSLSALRVRGSGRTDKGVHASGQVVAFDVPLKLLNLDDGNDHQSTISDSDHQNNGNPCDGDVGSSIERDDGKEEEETLSEHSIQHLREAFHSLDAHCSKTRNAEKDAKSFIDQWQIRRAITTRLPADIVIRSLQMWTGSRPFEPRKEIACKTYTYKLRFRCLSYLNSDNIQQSSSAGAIHEQEQKNVNAEEQLQIHPICNAGPHLLRRVNDQNTVWLCQWSLDPTLLLQACNAFVGERDFINFVHKEERKKANNNRRTGDANNATTDTNGTPTAAETTTVPKSPHEIDLFEFNVDTQSEREDDDPSLPPVINAVFTLKAKGFHRSMVRNLVGFVVDVARGLRSVDDIPMLLLLEKKAEEELLPGSKSSSSLAAMVNSAPACGLCLANVEYDHDHFL